MAWGGVHSGGGPLPRGGPLLWRSPQNINWSLGYLRDRFLDPSSSPHTLHHWVPSYRHMASPTKSLTRTFSFTIPGWWNDLPTPIRNAGSLSIFKQQLKTHLFHTTSTHKKIKKRFTFSKSSSFSLSFSPSLASLYLFEQCLRLGVASTSSVCLFKINHFMHSPIVSRFG